MNTLKTAAVTLLVATLSIVQASFADGRDRGGDGDRYDRYSRYDGHGDRDRWDARPGYRHYHRARHHHGHHHGHGHGYGYDYGYGHYERNLGYRAPVVAPRVVAPQIVVPLPLPPLPVIVLKKHHDAHVVLRPGY